MSECPIYQREHAVSEVVLLEKLRAVDLALEEGVKVENGSPSVSGED
jgi:hypothetical protein